MWLSKCAMLSVTMFGYDHVILILKLVTVPCWAEVMKLNHFGGGLAMAK